MHFGKILFVLAVAALTVLLTAPPATTGTVDVYQVLRTLEGHSARPYGDTGGTLTVCYGHTGGIDADRTYTDAECNAFLVQDTARFQDALDRLVTVDLTDSQYKALTVFMYNVGETAFRGSTLLRVLNAGEYSKVPYELSRWNKVTINGVLTVSNGLINRRNAEIAIWNEVY